MKQERIEMLLSTIDKMRATTIRQLRQIHDLGGYRNAAKVINQLNPYLHSFVEGEKIFYLNKEGRDLIGSNNEVKRSPIIKHTLLANEAYIYFKCPFDWRTEQPIEHEEPLPKGLTFKLGNTTLKTKKKLVTDAVFSRNGYVHLIEIDNTMAIQDNKKKIETYYEMWTSIKKEYNLQPILYFFTTTENRKKKLSNWLSKKGLRHEVITFNEIR